MYYVHYIRLCYKRLCSTRRKPLIYSSRNRSTIYVFGIELYTELYSIYHIVVYPIGMVLLVVSGCVTPGQRYIITLDVRRTS